MTVIGLTGGFATGKTFVGSLFRSYGARVIDADRIAHEVIRQGTPAYRRIARLFGRGILRRDGRIDRRALAEAVFADRRKRLALERIVHPPVVRAIMARLARSRVNDIVVIDAPLLIEAGLAKVVDRLVVVTATRPQQIRRGMKKFGMTEAEARQRIASQIPLRKKVRMADFVIDNSGSRQRTKQQARKVWCAVWI